MTLPADFPAQPGPARDAVILDHVRQRDVEVAWSTVVSEGGGHRVELRVFADALKIGGVRVTVSATLQQTIADMLGCSLLTTKIADLLFAQRVVTLPPHTQAPDATMVSTRVMVAQSAWIDAQVALAGGNPQGGIVQTVGKHWCVDNIFATNKATAGRALNYGWAFAGTFRGATWFPSATDPAVRVVQSLGWAHGPQEVDYSQSCLLVARTCFVDGVSRDLWDVARDPALASLVNASGPLRVLRQPGVPLAPFAGTPPPCLGPDCPQNVAWSDGGQQIGYVNPAIAWGRAAIAGLALAAGGYLAGRAVWARPRYSPRRRATISG